MHYQWIPPTCMMTWRPISRKCWTLVPSRNHTVHGLAWWSWSERMIGAWGSVLTSGNWTTGPSRILNNLQGSQWFSSLDLKSGYWQVPMDEESKPLTAFTVGLLGFYKCDRIPFRLTSAPATFQQLMETCLRDINLNWHIIYLDDIVIFSKRSS